MTRLIRKWSENKKEPDEKNRPAIQESLLHQTTYDGEGRFLVRGQKGVKFAIFEFSSAVSVEL